jgi:low affinity Fe/Cu permease
MSFCSRVKWFARHNERIADFFSLLAVALFFATIFVAIQYHNPLLSWMKANVVLHVPVVVGVIVLVVALIFFFLAIGAARFSEGEDEACFRTFRGRRHGGPSIGAVFHTWIDHMEHVNKKHR